ncbi:unnamed protein product [Caenorhabditis bovis]|uniref:C-type lectin domain-containing protein n=1 Tax=Caenorhabditis bovis TaxID=2654633 RepID=A0A8S1EQ29_9PELO|nr:unnamed protein product [Caenorhabditis bovis]
MHRAVFCLIISCWISLSIAYGVPEYCDPDQEYDDCECEDTDVEPCYQRNCPDSTWRRFVRPSGNVVCFKPITQNVNYAGAVSLCSSLTSNSKLFGIETQEEFDYLKSALGNRWYYIGAYRKDGCHAPKSVLLSRPECSVDKMFVFSDGVTEGTFLWNNHWSAQNPDSFYRNGEFESVIGIYNGLVGDWSTVDILHGAVCGLALC